MNIRFGVVGLGMGRQRSKLIYATPGIDLAAVCDINESLAKEVSEELDNVKYFTDYQKLLDRDDIDCIDIMTPSGMHADMAEMAAKAGKHILCTKPMDVSVEACDRMIAAAQKYNVKLAIDYESRYQPQNCRYHKAFEMGWFGKPLFIESRVKWYRSQEYYDKNGGWRGTWKMDGGGALANQGSHLLDAHLWFMGPVKSVYAEIATLNHDIETEDLGLAIVEFQNGARGLINATTTFSDNRNFDVELHGTKGSAVLRDIYAGGKKDHQASFIDKKTLHDFEEIEIENISCAAADMARYIKEDIPPRITGQEGRKVVAFLQAIYESARLGKKIEL